MTEGMQSLEDVQKLYQVHLAAAFEEGSLSEERAANFAYIFRQVLPLGSLDQARGDMKTLIQNAAISLDWFSGVASEAIAFIEANEDRYQFGVGMH